MCKWKKWKNEFTLSQNDYHLLISYQCRHCKVKLYGDILATLLSFLYCAYGWDPNNCHSELNIYRPEDFPSVIRVRANSHITGKIQRRAVFGKRIIDSTCLGVYEWKFRVGKRNKQRGSYTHFCGGIGIIPVDNASLANMDNIRKKGFLGFECKCNFPCYISWDPLQNIQYVTQELDEITLSFDCRDPVIPKWFRSRYDDRRHCYLSLTMDNDDSLRNCDREPWEWDNKYTHWQTDIKDGKYKLCVWLNRNGKGAQKLDFISFNVSR